MSALKVLGVILVAPFVIVYGIAKSLVGGWRDAGTYAKVESLAREFDEQAEMWDRFVAEDPTDAVAQRARVRAHVLRSLSRKLRRYELTPDQARAEFTALTESDAKPD